MAHNGLQEWALGFSMSYFFPYLNLLMIEASTLLHTLILNSHVNSKHTSMYTRHDFELSPPEIKVTFSTKLKFEQARSQLILHIKLILLMKC